MRSRPTRRSGGVASVVLTLAVLATGCGGGGNDAASTNTDAPAAATGAGADKPTGGGGGGAFCEAVKAQASTLNADSLDAATSADPAVRRQAYARAKELAANVAKVAPAEIRSDVQAQARDAGALTDAVVSSDAAALTTASARVSSPEFLAAANRVAAYVKDHCGIDFTAQARP